MSLRIMRLLLTIFAAISTLLMIFTLFFYARSYSRYEGMMHFSEGKPLIATAAKAGKIEDHEVEGRCSGWISSRGQLTYVSVADPVGFESWESWSQPFNTPSATTGPMVLVTDAQGLSGLGWGWTKTKSGLTDPKWGGVWKLPYWYFTVPYWALVVVLLILPWRWAVGYRQALQREKEGLCVRCGQSVRGLTGKCPKCGMAIPD